MNSKTVEQLNNLNKSFYNDVSEFFDRTRSYSWKGWDLLLTNLSEIKTVIDIGCGNGRFFKYLYENNISLTKYTGIDNNDFLLNKARESFQNKNCEFINSDILEQINTFSSDKYDLIVSFGVLHHIPGLENRKDFINYLISFSHPGSYICFSLWKFMDDKKYLSKLISPEEVNVDINDLEKDDYFLPWSKGTKSIRYCHYVSDEEEKVLFESPKLEIVSSYYADGKENNLNKYLIFKVYF